MPADNCNSSLVDDKLSKYESRAADSGIRRYSRTELFSLRRHSGRPDLNRLASLGLLFYRRHRGGKHARERMTKHRICIATSSIPPSNHNPNNNKSLGVNSSDSLISVISSASRNVPDYKTRARNRAYFRAVVNIDTFVQRHEPINDVNNNAHVVMFINPTSLAKDNALAQFTTDLLSFNSDIGMVAETWFKKSRHLEATLDINGYTLYVPILKHRLLRHFTSHLAGKQEKQFKFFWFCCKSISSDLKFFYCTVYHPPNPVYKCDNLINAILTDIEDICTKYLGSVISIVGDFNKLDTTKLETEAGLVQFVTKTNARKEYP